MKHEFLIFLPVAKAIAQLLYPHAEVVIHDLQTGKIAAIFNNYSKRVVGEDSQMEEDAEFPSYPDVFTPYLKRGWDGRKLKSTTVTIRDKAGIPIGLLCINIDVSALERFQKFIEGIMAGTSGADRPRLLFKEDWQEKISVYVHDYLNQRNLAVSSLPKEERHQLIQNLLQDGAFKAAKSADYVAQVLGISRATVFKHLSTLRTPSKRT